MTWKPCNAIRIATLLAAGGLLLQVGPCVLATAGQVVQSLVLSSVYQTVQTVLLNLLNV